MGMGLTDDFLVGAINVKKYKWKKTSEPMDIWDLKFSKVTRNKYLCPSLFHPI